MKESRKQNLLKAGDRFRSEGLAGMAAGALKAGGRMLRKAAAVSVLAAGCFTAVMSGAAAVGTMMGAAFYGQEASAGVHAVQPSRPSAIRAGPGEWLHMEDAMEMAESDKEACAALLGVRIEQMDERNVRKAAAMLVKEGDDFFGPEHPRVLLLRKLEKDAAEAASRHREADAVAEAQAAAQRDAAMALRM